MSEQMLCIHCSAPKEVDQEKSKPGEIHYKPCACGGIGICREGDRYQQILRKKANVPAYEKSPYRGGKLR